MGCRIHSLNPQLLHKRTTNLSCYNNQQPISNTTINKVQIPSYDVKFKTLGSCKLGISRYPDFVYNAEGGTGSGTATKISESDSNREVSIDFDVGTLYIPPLSITTTKFFGLPLPPFLRIDIVPQEFQGKIDQQSGKVDLKFIAKFSFSVGSIYKAAPLLVETILTSEESNGDIRSGKGNRLDKNGICKLVGVATVQPINDIFMDTFLSLPTECLAELNAIISITETI